VVCHQRCYCRAGHLHQTPDTAGVSLWRTPHRYQFFDLVRYHNEGAAFSFLANAGGWQKWFFTAITAIAVIVISYLLTKHHRDKLFSFGLALVLGGAIGNLYDRLTLGYVVDFLYFHIDDLYWPAFNVADSAICIGVGILLLDSFRKEKLAAKN